MSKGCDAVEDVDDAVAVCVGVGFSRALSRMRTWAVPGRPALPTRPSRPSTPRTVRRAPQLRLHATNRGSLLSVFWNNLLPRAKPDGSSCSADRQAPGARAARRDAHVGPLLRFIWFEIAAAASGRSRFLRRIKRKRSRPAKRRTASCNINFAVE